MLDEVSQRRALVPRAGIDFSSNNYLGFAHDPVLKAEVLARLPELELGASGARLLRGHQAVFEEVEQELADFCGQESALIFPSGYQANLALLSGLLTSQDYVFSDQLNHASLIDGIRLSGAQKVIYPHRDLGVLREALERTQSVSGRALRVIVTESLFGMDGDQAPLRELADLADEYGALWVADEAHATGLWGDFSRNRGGGLVQSHQLSSRVFATIHTGGKALGIGGAWVCGGAKLKELLVNFARPFIYSTAPLPALVRGLGCAVDYWKRVGPARARRVLESAEEMRQALAMAQVPVAGGLGPIVPVILGDNERALSLAHRLQLQGFDVRPIRPPTVPVGTARLRLCIHDAHSEENLRELQQALLSEWVGLR